MLVEQKSGGHESECVSCACTRNGLFGKGETSLGMRKRKKGQKDSAASDQAALEAFPNLLESKKEVRKPFFKGRKKHVEFRAKHKGSAASGQRFRHVKLDIKLLVEKRTEKYCDKHQPWSWSHYSNFVQGTRRAKP